MATEKQPVPMINIDGKEYAIESLSDTARAQLINLRVCDEEIARLQSQLAIVGTARQAYALTLANELPKETTKKAAAKKK